MTAQKKGITTYKRDKSKVEISGDPENVKWPMWFDMISNTLRWLFLAIMLLIIVPRATFLPILVKWIKHLLPFLILFMAVVDYGQIFLSG
jgi:hypothetical protein